MSAGFKFRVDGLFVSTFFLLFADRTQTSEAPHVLSFGAIGLELAAFELALEVPALAGPRSSKCELHSSGFGRLDQVDSALSELMLVHTIRNVLGEPEVVARVLEARGEVQEIDSSHCGIRNSVEGFRTFTSSLLM